MYNFLRFFILYPIIFFVKLFSRKQRKFFNKRFHQDFNDLKNKEYIWVHCASMGEVNLSESLVKELLFSRSENILFSVFTDTGYENARSKYNNFPRVKVIYFPLDDKRDIKKILSKIKLNLLILVETELWPNLIKYCSLNGKVIMVNGRISDKSFKTYLRYKILLKNMLKSIHKFYMQSNLDSERIVSLGAEPAKVTTLGNLKFCINFEEYSSENQEELRKSLKVNKRKVIVLGSTREREEEKIIKSLTYGKDKLLVIVPRHIERTEEIAQLLEKYRMTYVRYSDIEKTPLDRERDVIIVNKMGVLRRFYSIADVAFVGGTLVNIGGHSLLEPLFYGKIPLFGKYYQNVKEIAKELLDRKLGVSIEHAGEFEMAVNEILAINSKKDLIEKLFLENSHIVKTLKVEIDKLISEKN